MMIYRKLISFVVVVSSMLFASSAFADSITGGWPGRDTVQKGVSELGIDNILLANSDSVSEDTSDASTSQLSIGYRGGVSFRHFIIDNLALGIHGGLLYRLNQFETSTGAGESVTESSDMGAQSFLTADYYMPLTDGMFFKPSVGLGGFYAERSVPEGTEGQDIESDIYGFSGKMGLGLAFYINQHFVLSGGGEIVLNAGTNKQRNGTTDQGLLNINAGFNLGMAFVF